MAVNKKMTLEEKVKQANAWVAEDKYVSGVWRAQAWRDCEMADGLDAMWTQDDWDDAINSGIDPMSFNRIFPVIQYIMGSEIINKFNSVAKARTHKDSEMSEVMTESLAYIRDQSDGNFLISQAFGDAIISGFGCLSPCLNPDPREEKVSIDRRPWTEIGWDPFSSIWWSPKYTKYVYHQRWMDIDNLIMAFEKKEKEILDKYADLSAGANTTASGNSYMYDFADEVEGYLQTLAPCEWADTTRKRIRPVEMWYPQIEKATFCLFDDGRAIEMKDSMSAFDKVKLIQACQEIVNTPVKKMRTMTFVDNLVLQDRETPYPHDLFPFIPFVGYLDRYGFPYGVPRQIRTINEDINKRRSVAKALLTKRRIKMEKGIVDDAEEMDQLIMEANKIDGAIVVNNGKLDKVIIDDQIQMEQAQIGLLIQDENEIREISGANAESLAYKSNVTSGVAQEKKIEQAATIHAPLFHNHRRSIKLLNEQLSVNAQGFWKGPKVLRITDRMTGRDRFITINEEIEQITGIKEIKNNITQGRFDIIISEAQQTDTIREQNLNLIIEWVKKSPPEVIPVLMNMAFEMSNLPNKDILIEKIKPLLGQDPRDEDMSPEQLKQRTIQILEQQKQAQAAQAQTVGELQKLEMENKRLENEKLMAEIKEIQERLKIERAKTVSEMKSSQAQTGGKVLENIDKARATLDFVRNKKAADMKNMEKKAVNA